MFILSDYYSRKPTWFEPVQLTDWAIQAVVIFTVAVLLMLPSARPYFRKPGSAADAADPGTVSS
jgi:hypothetical protein